MTGITLPSYYDKCNVLSKVTFTWVWQFFLRTKSKSSVEISDLEKCNQEDRSEILGHRLNVNWEKQLKLGEKKGQKASLLRAIHDTFGWEYFLYGCSITFAQCFLMIYQTVMMGNMVQYLAQGIEDRKWIWFNGAGVVIFQGIIVMFYHPYFYNANKIGMDIRIACCHLMYKKTLKLSKASLSKTSIGQIINYMSNDVNRFDWLLHNPHYLFVGPLMTIITTSILWVHADFNTTCLPIPLFLILYLPFQGALARVFSSLRSQTADLTDERVKITNEFVKAIKVIKMYAWELPFCELVNKAREKEVLKIKQAAYLRGLNLSIFFVVSKIIMFFIIGWQIWTGHLVNSSNVFVAMSLINQLRTACCSYLPYAVSTGAETFVSMDRIQKFLLLHEFVPLTVTEVKDPMDSQVKMDKVSGRYGHVTDDTLRDIDLHLKPGELCTVIGPVGSGKSSVIMSILGELPVTKGTLTVHGKVSYASQEAWLVNGTVRDNILFGKPYDIQRYDEVVNVAALKRDFTLLPNDDKTIVGDRGLSGGQRARINLARALYHQADIYLLDDPLSAVDAHVAKHIFEQTVRGFLKNKITILVTHQLQFVKSAEKILLLNHGRPEVYGDYNDLLKTKPDFMRFNMNTQPNVNANPESDGIGDLTESAGSSLVGGHYPLGKSTSSLSESFTGRKLRPIRQVSSYSKTSTHSAASNKSHHSGKSHDLRARIRSIARQDSKVTMSTSFVPSMSNEVGPSHFHVEDVIGDEDITLNEDVFNSDEGGDGDEAAASSQAYWVYISAGGGCTSLMINVFGLSVTQLLYSFNDWWVSIWTNDIDVALKEGLFNQSNGFDYHNIPVQSPFLMSDHWSNINLYGLQTLLIIVFCLFRTTVFFWVCMKASVNLHDKLFRSVVRAPMSFFDNNPVGILLNRCSRDMGIIDDILPPTLFDALSTLILDLGCALMICFVDYWIIIPTILLLAISLYFRRLYVPIARGVKRLEGITRSPVFSHLSTSINGVCTIRALKAEKRFQQQFDINQNNHTSAWWYFLAFSRWFGVTIDWMCIVYIGILMVSMLSQDSSGSEVGLTITSAILLALGFQWGVRQLCEVETQMISVERVNEFAFLPSEGELETSDPRMKPPPEWPQHGKVDFVSATMCYKEDDPPVLNDLKFSVNPGEKVGIVGRTGAGKSSIINALFRLNELSDGSIYIDGHDISLIGLHDLRKKISIIPQEPVLFSGTIRRNLDPFNEISDGKLWRALDEVQLRESVQEISKGLEAYTSEEMNHFSVGQRQLLCLARAILRENKLLILDEATANVDPRTDALIQNTIRNSFKHCTVLTIAHRLDTIIDSDRVLVMDAGLVVEFDEPINLLKMDDGIFYQMCKATGKDTFMKLKLTAQKAADARGSSSSPAATEQPSSPSPSSQGPSEVIMEVN